MRDYISTEKKKESKQLPRLSMFRFNFMHKAIAKYNASKKISNFMLKVQSILLSNIPIGPRI
jgi:hypothetical protein